MNFFSCCYSTPSLSPECLQQVDKALGNIKNSHKAIAFIGVVQLQGQKASMLQYQYNHLNMLQSPSKHGSFQASSQPQSINQIKEKVEKILERTISFKIAQRKIAREMGFDSSKEIFIKGDQSVVIIYEIGLNTHGTNVFAYNNGPEMKSNTTEAGNPLLVIFLEMNALKVEFFDCETFITTIDDLIVSLIEALNYDNAIDTIQNEQNQEERRDRNT